MAFDKIEVHFPTSKGRRIAVVRGERVEAIFLGASESRFFPPEEIPTKKSPPKPEVIPVVNATGEPANDVLSTDGPQVCYLIDGQLHCW